MSMKRLSQTELAVTVEEVMSEGSGYIHLTSSCGEDLLYLKLKEDSLDLIVELLQTYDDTNRILIFSSSFSRTMCTPRELADAIRIGRRSMDINLMSDLMNSEDGC